MAQIVRVIDDPVMLGQTAYYAQVCGRQTGHTWEGWIEFADAAGSDVRRTARETTQPDRNALVYWAQGLSMTYLEGALLRTMERPIIEPKGKRAPYFDTPAPPLPELPEGPPSDDRAVLDPFLVAAQGPDLLRRKLGALRAWHLRNIVRAYKLADPGVDLDSMRHPELLELIVGAVEPT